MRRPSGSIRSARGGGRYRHLAHQSLVLTSSPPHSVTISSGAFSVPDRTFHKITLPPDNNGSERAGSLLIEYNRSFSKVHPETLVNFNILCRMMEGTIPFDAPGHDKPLSTWYKIFGDLQKDSSRPLIILHGGPGMCHEYMLPVAVYASAPHEIPVIFYDQVGNGKSSRLRDKMGDQDFWTVELFNAELNNLIDQLQIRDRGYDILGQSWGGMLAAYHATTQPKGLGKIIVANSPASVPLWEISVNMLKTQLPADVQETIDRCEAAGDFESEEYEKATDLFYQKHLSLKRPWPTEEVQVALAHAKEDPTVYLTMFGPSEMTVTGTLKNWSLISELHKIQIPVLLINGYYDEAQDVCVKPFFDHINKVKWVTLQQSGHLAHADEPERFNEVVLDFLKT